jgi:hypothetical protein
MVASVSPARAGLPLVAVLLAWFVPGLGHLYLGRLLPALIGFVVIEGLFVAGALLAAGASFAMLDPDLRSAAAYTLTPELGNLGGFLWQFGQHADAQQPLLPRLFGAREKLGVLLMALSGLGNLAWISAAHFEARRQAAKRLGNSLPGGSPALPAAINMLLPGAGYLYQGRRSRGLLLGALLLALYGFGLWLSEGSPLERERHYYYWSAQLLIGLPALLAAPFAGVIDQVIPRQDLGVFYAGLAGLLNLLTCLDVYAYQAARLLGQDPVNRQPERAPAARGTAPNKHLVGSSPHGGPA